MPEWQFRVSTCHGLWQCPRFITQESWRFNVFNSIKKTFIVWQCPKIYPQRFTKSDCEFCLKGWPEILPSPGDAFWVSASHVALFACMLSRIEAHTPKDCRSFSGNVEVQLNMSWLKNLKMLNNGVTVDKRITVVGTAWSHFHQRTKRRGGGFLRKVPPVGWPYFQREVG